MAIMPAKQKCDKCGKSLVCPECGQFLWSKVVIEDNAIDPWYFCSEECRAAFMREKHERT